MNCQLEHRYIYINKFETKSKRFTERDCYHRETSDQEPLIQWSHFCKVLIGPSLTLSFRLDFPSFLGFSHSQCSHYFDYPSCFSSSPPFSFLFDRRRRFYCIKRELNQGTGHDQRSGWGLGVVPRITAIVLP